MGVLTRIFINNGVKIEKATNVAFSILT